MVVVVRTHIRKGGRYSSSTVASEAEAEIYTGEKGTNRTGEQADRVDIREETGVVAEAMGIHPTSHTPKTYSGADNMPVAMEIGWFEV